MRGTDLETLRQYLLALDLDAGQKMIDEMGETHSSAHILMHWVMPVGRQYFDGSFTWSAAIPNVSGDKALYTVKVQKLANHSTTETRVLDVRTGTSTVFSDEAYDREVTWLGRDNQVVWLRDAEAGTTEVWIADAVSLTPKSYCAGSINRRAFCLKVHSLDDEDKDVAIAVACPANADGSLHDLEDGTAGFDAMNTIWYTTLKQKAFTHSSKKQRYMIHPTRWVNALHYTSLASPLASPYGASDDFNISSSGIAFVSQDPRTGFDNPLSINLCFIPLRTFTEVSRPRYYIIRVAGYEGRSSHPVFSPDGNSVAFLKKKHPTDQTDRNRIIVVNNMREFPENTSLVDIPIKESEKEWHLSPYSVGWSDEGKELYVVAVDRGIRRLFKIPAALSSIKWQPQPITSTSKTPTDVRYMRMVFSAPMKATS